MATVRITKTTIEAAPIPAGRDAYYWDDRVAGFGFRVTPKGVRSYVVQYRVYRQRTRRITIGKHGSPWTAELARREAIELLTGVRRGADPLEEKRRKAIVAEDLRFDKYVETFVDKHLKLAWSDTWTLAERRLEMYAIPILKSRPLPDIGKRDIAAILDPIRDKPGVARNTHAVLRLLFNWAVDRDDLPISPMHGLKAPAAPKARKRVLSPDEILALWWASFELAPPYDRFIRCLLCTLQRRVEVAALPWGELDQNAAQWRLEGERAKNEVEHIVPLNELALVELAGLGWKSTGFVFTTTGDTPISGFSKWKKKLDARMLAVLQEIADLRAAASGDDPVAVKMTPWVLHDIRRTGVTQMQALGIPIEVTEKCLNHVSGETRGIRGVYNRYEYLPEKAAAFRAWGARLAELIAEGDRLRSRDHAQQLRLSLVA